MQERVGQWGSETGGSLQVPQPFEQFWPLSGIHTGEDITAVMGATGVLRSLEGEGGAKQTLQSASVGRLLPRAFGVRYQPAPVKGREHAWLRLLGVCREVLGLCGQGLRVNPVLLQHFPYKWL